MALPEPGARPAERSGVDVVRCYLTRHGPEPLVTEDPTLELPEPHNGTGAWQGVFRAGVSPASECCPTPLPMSLIPSDRKSVV